MMYFNFLIRGPTKAPITRPCQCWFPEFLDPLHLLEFWPPLTSGCNQKFKNPALLKGFLNGISQPESAKTQKEDRILGNRLLPHQVRGGGGPHGDGHLTEQYDFCHLLTVKIWKRFKHSGKSYSIYAHTQPHILHPYRWGRDFFLYWNLYHFTSLRSFVCFTPFVKDTQKIRKKEARNGQLKKTSTQWERKVERATWKQKNKRPATKLVIQRKLGPLTTCFRIFGHHHHHRHRRLGIQNKIRRSKVCYCQCDQIKY